MKKLLYIGFISAALPWFVSCKSMIDTPGEETGYIIESFLVNQDDVGRSVEVTESRFRRDENTGTDPLVREWYVERVPTATMVYECSVEELELMPDMDDGLYFDLNPQLFGNTHYGDNRWPFAKGQHIKRFPTPQTGVYTIPPGHVGEVFQTIETVTVTGSFTIYFNGEHYGRQKEVGGTWEATYQFITDTYSKITPIE